MPGGSDAELKDCNYGITGEFDWIRVIASGLRPGNGRGLQIIGPG